jgi:hypothetical protein
VGHFRPFSHFRSIQLCILVLQGIFLKMKKDEKVIEQEIEQLCPFQVDFGFFFSENIDFCCFFSWFCSLGHLRVILRDLKLFWVIIRRGHFRVKEEILEIHCVKY